MDREVRKTEAELNRALAEIDQLIASVKANSVKVNCDLSDATQKFEASETAVDVLTKNDRAMNIDESNILAKCQRKDKEIASLQNELLGLFNLERGQHKKMYSGLMGSMKEMLTLKKDFDAVKLSMSD